MFRGHIGVLQELHPGMPSHPHEGGASFSVGPSGQVTMTVVECQPVAPDGKGACRFSGCRAPVVSVARTSRVWLPGVASHSQTHCFQVSDEGEYWETRDDSVLLKNVGHLNHIMAAFGGRLADSGLRVEGEIFSHPDFERLEMGEVE